VIVRRYRTGSVISVHIELTANHHGYFEFRICAMTYHDREVTQECLDQHLLRAENGSTRYYPGPGNRIFESYYKLPEGLTCTQCVFQWRYIAGNNWGDCGNGTGTSLPNVSTRMYDIKYMFIRRDTGVCNVDAYYERRKHGKKMY